ncbi:type II secretion system GspH family protein [Simiduia sp. 21SJ11W-1]|uniref:PulJ/GspJ family protein n=1 Tax=Simiduia sp. 21SJ11W-1 TaxID=2909669 RepID=UPI0020A181E3|nr:type II secretion system protein [Simiduia sp. 21SJ11W-1]UTA46578.1 type II secretion system GspH family protein [Simiduia sp. 21SJ11W-1]
MNARGFTLVELIAVLVVFAVIAALGTGFVASSFESYSQSVERTRLVNESRAVIERIARQLHMALPYSVRVSSSGQCMEFMQITGGSNYFGNLPDTNNGAAAVATIDTAPFSLNLGGAVHVAVGAMAPGEVYTTSTTASRATVAATVGNPVTRINLAANHRFIRNSINERVYVTESPERFCVLANQMQHFSNYGLITGSVNDADPGGVGALMANDVVPGSPTFVLSPATETRNSLITIAFGITRNGETLSVNHQVQLRNVP